jgi:hypothetical protein
VKLEQSRPVQPATPKFMNTLNRMAGLIVLGMIVILAIWLAELVTKMTIIVFVGLILTGVVYTGLQVRKAKNSKPAPKSVEGDFGELFGSLLEPNGMRFKMRTV